MLAIAPAWTAGAEHWKISDLRALLRPWAAWAPQHASAVVARCSCCPPRPRDCPGQAKLRRRAAHLHRLRLLTPGRLGVLRIDKQMALTLCKICFHLRPLWASLQPLRPPWMSLLSCPGVVRGRGRGRRRVAPAQRHWTLMLSSMSPSDRRLKTWPKPCVSCLK